MIIRTKLTDHMDWSLNGIDIEGDNVLPHMVSNEKYRLYTFSEDTESIVIDVDRNEYDEYYDEALEVVSLSSSKDDWNSLRSTISVKNEKFPLVILNKQHVFTLTNLPDQNVHVMIRTIITDMDWSLHGIDAQGKNVPHKLVTREDDRKFSLYTFVGQRVKSIVIDVTRNRKNLFEKKALKVLGISSSIEAWNSGMEGRKRRRDEKARENSDGPAKKKREKDAPVLP